MQNVLSWTTYECSQVSFPGNRAIAAFDLAAASCSSPGARFCTPGRVRSITNLFIALLHRWVGRSATIRPAGRPRQWQECQSTMAFVPRCPNPYTFRMSALPVSLEDKYTLASGRIFLTGTQALVRLAMVQRERDLAAGLNTAGFISGYRGSPLGGFDQALWKAKKHLKEHHIHFTPGVNEELALSAVWGTQQVGLFEGAKYDGVFAMWYGKGPGVDRSGDVMKHANAAGSSKNGGVLLLAGDDHACKSSTLPHQSEHAFDAAMIPVLYPTGVQEIIELGLHGFAMSRYSGCYVAFKVVSETVDASASITLDPDSPRIVLPDDFQMPEGGVNIRWPDAPMEQELRLQRDKVYAALAYARVNKLNRVTIDSPRPRLGIIAAGKSYLDVLQGLEDLGIDEKVAAEIGIRLCKVGMPWPLEPTSV